ncbi:MAG: MopE-related protein, partial [Myxococcota bacterium]
DSTVNPAKTEVCNSKDDDCDTLIDDLDPTVSNQTTYYFDGDSDGYGRSSPITKTCGSAPAGYAAQSGDCDDVNAQVKPNATETCNGIDDDCDSKIDAADSPVTGTLNYYPDADLDTYGSSSIAAQAACAQNPPAGKVTNNTDCNDSDATVNPSKTEVCNSKDDDCDGSTDDADTSITGQSTWYQDSDGDTYGNAAVSQKACNKPQSYVSDNTDCNDTNNAIKPGAQEICDNGVDNDCDGKADDNDPSLKDGPITVTKVNTYYADNDKDGYGQDTSTVQACTQPANYSSQKGDCNDGNNSIYPGAVEGTVNNPSLNCVNGNSIDNDCDGIIDEGTCDYDDDGDKQTERDGDCDDAAPTTGKGFPELCNGVDDDCDGKNDEDYDVDLDGQLSASLCTGIALPNATDCDDSDPNIYKGATPVCDGKDTDCSKGTGDPGNPDTGYTSESDTDKDGFRACGKDKCSGSACEGTEDCDDIKATVFPGAPELCDELDNDCNSKVDDFTDNDGDGFNSCDDCNDNANTTYPSAPELCDGSDNNCDGVVPSSGPSSENDNDKDGFRVCDDDCNDSDKVMFPDNEEVCDEKDNDCNGTADDDAIDEEIYFADDDADSNGDPRSTVTGCEVPPGYVINAEDCDDENSSIYQDAPVQCDGLDHDCDGTADYLNEDFDADNDGFLSATLCSGLPSDYQLDCNDSNNKTYPGAEEKPDDAIDNNCDGSLSEDLSYSAGEGGITCSLHESSMPAPSVFTSSVLLLLAAFLRTRTRSTHHHRDRSS